MLPMNLWSFLIVSAIVFPCAPVAAESPDKNLELQKGQQFTLCQELEEIINLPVNSGLMGEFCLAKEIIFPERYKDFHAVEWVPIPKDEVGQYVFREETKARLELEKERAIRNKKWDGTEELAFERASVNFDHWRGNGNETTIRYRFPGEQVAHCLLPDTAEEDYRKDFNGNDIKSWSGKVAHFPLRTSGCQIFTYKGRVYHTAQMCGGYLHIYEPSSSAREALNKQYRALYDIHVCVFNKPSVPSSAKEE